VSTVIDASALIAFLRDEPGADVVENLFSAPETCYAHALNLCEVCYDFFRASNSMQLTRQSQICLPWGSRN
jgi:PIN domain nuclease of toxin-antitoxin system